jgi:chemotaxis protein MotB
VSRGREVLGAALALALAGTSAGCVRKETHQKALEELERYRESEAALAADLEKARAELAALGAAMEERDAASMESEGARADLTSRLGSAEEQNEELGGRLEAASRSLDALKGKNGELTSELVALRSRIDELRDAQAAAERRAARQRAILEGFQAMIDAGDLEVEVEGGRVLLVLENDVLFEPGRAEVRGEGRRVLRAIGEKLAGMDDLELQVAGHTDDTPIDTPRFPSNWELSTARAVEVVRLLEDEGVEPSRLSAAGYGEHRPTASNDAPEGRAENRRIEIALVPDLAPVLEGAADEVGGDDGAGDDAPDEARAAASAPASG